MTSAEWNQKKRSGDVRRSITLYSRVVQRTHRWEDYMSRNSFSLAVAAGLLAAATVLSAPAAAQGTAPATPAAPAAAPAQGAVQFVPSLVYRTGTFAPSGTPYANGFADYITLINERDGGINGVRLLLEECETAYQVDRGVECYERLKTRHGGAVAFSPVSTGIAYALIERSARDKIPLITMGLGRGDASDGTVFPYVFTLPTTYWSGASALINYIAQREGGIDKLRGKTIAHVYIDIAYGREPIRTFQALADKHGFTLKTFPIPSPAIEQRATWLQIRQLRPDYVVQWNWGVANPTAIREAANVNFPRDRFIGVWYSGMDNDVIPVGDAAIGYHALNFHGVGSNFPVHRDIQRFVVDRKLRAGDGTDFGQVGYNRGMINAIYTVEAIRTAMSRFGNRPITGEEMQWGLENLNLDNARLAKLGLEGLVLPVRMSCGDHEGGGQIFVQRWDGKEWQKVSDWISPDRKLVWDLKRESAAQFARENNIQARTCPPTTN